MKRLFQVLAISALVLTGLVASASAQTVATSTKVKIDFDFTAGKQQFPAGKYRIKTYNDTQSQTLLLVQRLDGKEQGIVATLPNRNRGKLGLGDVSFNKYGDKYFLANVQVGDGSLTHHILKSRSERNLQQMSVKIAGVEPKQLIVPATDQ
ncbi:MAG: hypothetical protein M3X11_02060 [Acidobacteriota bacterium]|nr:hypothetical protein [Acidobacteriota bacterium]